MVATGFYDVPNRLDVPGENLPHVSHYYKEPYQHTMQPVWWWGQELLGQAALQLTRAGARVTLLFAGPPSARA